MRTGRLSRIIHHPLTNLADEWIDGIWNAGHSGWETYYGVAISENLKPARYRCFGCVGVEILGGTRRFGSVEVYELVFFDPCLVYYSHLRISRRAKERNMSSTTDSLLLSKASFVFLLSYFVCNRCCMWSGPSSPSSTCSYYYYHYLFESAYFLYLFYCLVLSLDTNQQPPTFWTGGSGSRLLWPWGG